jgi:serine/threonine protein phosphatase PrpC
LSVDKIGEDGGGGSAEAESSDDQRGLIANLSKEGIIDIIGQTNASNGPGRKFSIGSSTDPAKVSFADKIIKQAGDDVDPAALGKQGLGFTCRKGLKPESPNQDSWAMLKVEDNFSIYGVYDGHGQKGHDVSNFVKDNMPKLILKDPRFAEKDFAGMMPDHFRMMQQMIITADRMKKLSAQMSGTTATVVVHDHTENKLTIAHVADSTCVLGQYTSPAKKELKAITLTEDHKPNLKKERERIEKAGGRVVFDGYMNHRVYAKNGRYPGLNMSRCLGDLMGHADAGCSCEPDVLERPVTPEDYVLLLCSDGVWEFIDANEALRIVSQYDSTKASQAAAALAKEAWDRWIQEESGAVVDDITVVLVYLQPPGNDV